MVRLKAVWYSLYYSVLPWWMYEEKKHYDISYFDHLIINLKYAWRWATSTESASDREFEKKVNNNYFK